MNRTARTNYDEVPYPGLSHSNTHPDSMAVLAILSGMQPAPVERCRVLELGCAVGGNLLPMAYGLPDSEFVGIDASGGQIAEGMSAVTSLGLRNLTLKQMDILEVEPDLGEFDYIIAHGVYSWVPLAVQEKVLEICRRNLAPNGVSFVSYNTYPGWHMIDIVRGIMLYHTRNMTDPEQRAEEARSILKFMAESCGPENDAYTSFIKMYAEYIDGKLEDARPRSDAVLLHDELEQFNQPLYFHQFAEQAERHGLQYLTDLYHLGANKLQPEVTRSLASMAKSLVDMEQYADFLQNRTFRQTLLCHQDVTLSRSVRPELAKGFHLASRAEPVSSQPDIHGPSVEQFRCRDGATLSTDHPVSKSAMLCLAKVWPRTMSFDQLLYAAQNRLAGELKPAGATPQETGTELDAQVLAANMLKASGYSYNLVELHAYAPRMVLDVDDRPLASPVARFQVRSSHLVTNMRHERIALDGLERFLLPLVDGSRDRDDLLELTLAGPVAAGHLKLEKAGEMVSPDGEQELLAEELEQRLRGLARAALLVAPSGSGD